MAFDPTQITGLILWLDASQLTTLTNSPSAASPALGNITTGTAVGTWYDASGNGNHFSQATANNQPTFLTTGHIGTGGTVAANYCVQFIATAGESGGSDVGSEGQRLTERSASLHTTCGTDNTVLMLLYKNSSAEDSSYQTFLTNNTGGSGAEFLLRFSGKFTRYNGSAGATLSESATHALVYTYASSGTVESFYIDSAAATVATYSSGRPAMTSGAFSVSDNVNALNGQVCEYLVYNSALLNTQIAEIFAYWNTKWGTSFNASAGPLTTGTLQATNVSKTTQTVSSSNPSGGTSPYAYKWYRSTTSGTASAIAVSGNLVSGATALTLNDTGLTVQTIYYYVLQTTDSATPTPAVVLSVVLTAPTHGNTTVKIAFIGDSITYGAESTVSPPTAYGLALQAAYPQLDVQIYNYGFSGQEFRYYSRLSYPGGTNGSSGVIGLLTTLQAAGITYLCIEEGTNDCYNSAAMYGTDTSMTPTNYAADMVDVTGYLTSHGITCFVNEIIYRGTTMDNATTGIPAYNAAAQGITYGGLLILGDTSAYAFFKANSSLLVDGTHPGVTGSIDLGNYWEAASGATIANDMLSAMGRATITLARSRVRVLAASRPRPAPRSTSARSRVRVLAASRPRPAPRSTSARSSLRVLAVSRPWPAVRSTSPRSRVRVLAVSRPRPAVRSPSGRQPVVGQVSGSLHRSTCPTNTRRSRSRLATSIPLTSTRNRRRSFRRATSTPSTSTRNEPRSSPWG